MKIEICGIDMYYEVFGEGIPMVIIPGLFINSQSMIPVMEPILAEKNSYQRIYMDVPGMGNTPMHALANTTESMIHILASFVEKVVGRTRLYILGYSYGGYLAMGLAQKLQEQVLGEIRICPVIHAKMSERTLPNHKVMEKDSAFLKTLSQEQLLEASKNLTIINERTYTRYKQEIVEQRKKSDRKFLLDLFFNGYKYDALENKAMDVKWPILFILGKQDSVCGYKDVLNALENYRNPTVHLMNKASHNLPIEQEEWLKILISSWLKDQENKDV